MQILRDITIRKMILLILVVFSIIWGMATLLTFYNFSTIDQLLTQNASQKNAYAMLVKGNDQYFRTMTRMLRAMDYRQTGDEANAAKTMDSAAKALATSQNMLAQFRDAQHPGVSDDVIKAMINDWDALLTNAIVPMYDAAKNNQPDKFRELFRKTYPPLSVQFGATAEKYTQAIQSDAILVKTKDQMSYNKIVLISALLAGLVTLLLTDRYLVNYLVKPLGMLKNHLELLTAGKLSSQLETFGRNCAGQLIPYVQKMQESLHTTVKTIQDSSASIFANTSEIRGGNEELSSRTEQQAAALQQTAASMEELTSTVKNNAQNVREALKLTEEAQKTAKRGGDITSTVVQTMHGITDSSQKISDITSVINSISFQTNLLALNAAVEAARAGEQGRGFAVVASEVRLLAQRSAQAAKEIEALISESVNRVKTGAEQVQEAGDAMSVIIQSVAQVNSLMGEISVASDEQSRGIEQIGLAMTEMDGVTQQNATLVQEATANAVSLESEAERLNKTVDRFDLGNGVVSATRSAKKTSVKTQRVPVSTPSNDNWQTF
ncbi:MAG: methyl-accepting chemotaxis protein [Enterobacteriaceae bacterium]|jgi:methyl-accepting chemotaxis protein|uniref:methyl-accepting chemotaxis protein n=1 Tax=Phytobacter diazotrophicus TaxID=395631 RepID=UPI000D167BEE|nr:methyl-accepting chemotaxis protein [Phytobacter diazotrophicus]MDU4996963.1 methyl-accepting chemotaxis protein [Enterobacteriaceae bacterium]PTA97460.1 methyl-accepting chemotaxis protein [Kluyvera sp. Nf5]MBY6255253.1 Tar ligand binding domain-containing protein [Phytobacter diazotrophicus]MDU7197771.1 methyl-accepting chemotaxis protein [Enterobacteriaceae bacterium]MDV2874692.1 methyl-accepting chemotaxis protein [Phytobacter diazotrophicus]